MSVKLEPANPQSRVKLSTTDRATVLPNLLLNSWLNLASAAYANWGWSALC